ncbi:MAG: thermonuclease family protein [Thermoguttaceae bacterium]|nr:thermonuclease family protein [Thermoguttaceae bacterium]
MTRRAFCFALILAAFFAVRAAGAEMIVPDAVPEFETVKVERVIDGDTIEIKSDELGTQSVRLVGVNCPEWTKKKEPFGNVATEFTTEALAAAGNVITLETDGEIYDRFNRRLAVVWLGKQTEGESLNEQLLRAGLAVANLKYEYSDELKDRYRAAVADAMDNAQGLYGGENDAQLADMEVENEKQFALEEGKFWVSNTGKIHSRTCKFFQKGNGYFTNEDDLEKHCKLCFNSDGSRKDDRRGESEILAQPRAAQQDPPKGPFWVSHTGKVHCQGCRYYGQGDGEFVDDLAGLDNLCGVCMLRTKNSKKSRRTSEDKK